MSILFKFWKTFDFGQNLRKKAIFFFKNFDLSQIFEKKWFGSNFLKKFPFCFLFSVEINEKFWFFLKFRKMSIWVKFSKKLDFGEIFEKNRFWSCFGKKFRFWSKFPKNVDFFGNFEKNSILSNFRKNCEFGQNLRKTFFLNLEKFRFWSNFRIFRFWSWFSKKNWKNYDFG